MTTETHPLRRKNDTGWRRLWHENAYRDVWLLIITVVTVGSIVFGYKENSARIKDLCIVSNRQNAAIIAVIRSSMPPGASKAEKAFLAQATKLFPQQQC